MLQTISHESRSDISCLKIQGRLDLNELVDELLGKLTEFASAVLLPFRKYYLVNNNIEIDVVLIVLWISIQSHEYYSETREIYF